MFEVINDLEGILHPQNIPFNKQSQRNAYTINVWPLYIYTLRFMYYSTCTTLTVISLETGFVLLVSL